MSNSQVGYCGTRPSDTPPGWTFFARRAPITFCIPGPLPSYFSPILMYKARLPKIKYKPTSPHQLFCFQKCSSDSSLLLTVSALVAALRVTCDKRQQFTFCSGLTHSQMYSWLRLLIDQGCASEKKNKKKNLPWSNRSLITQCHRKGPSRFYLSVTGLALPLAVFSVRW